MDNSLNKRQLPDMKLLKKYPDFSTFDFDSAFDVHPEKHFVIGFVSKDGYFQRRVTDKDRAYTFCKRDKSSGHTSALVPRISLAFFGLINGSIMAKSVRTHKQIGCLRNAHPSKRVNCLVSDRRGRVLISGGSDHMVRFFSLKKPGFPELKSFCFQSDVVHLRLSPSEKLLSVGKFVYNTEKELSIIRTEKYLSEKAKK